MSTSAIGGTNLPSYYNIPESELNAEQRAAFQLELNEFMTDFVIDGSEIINED